MTYEELREDKIESDLLDMECDAGESNYLSLYRGVRTSPRGYDYEWGM